jgi:hypothetical protein
MDPSSPALRHRGFPVSHEIETSTSPTVTMALRLCRSVVDAGVSIATRRGHAARSVRLIFAESNRFR